MDRDEARDRLAEALCLFRDEVRPATRERLVTAAVEALVAGLDSPALAELAGAYPDDAPSALRLTADTAAAELRLHVPAPDQVETVKVRRKILDLLAGSISPRELAAWAHREIGHEGLPSARWFVEADDEYDVLEYSTLTVEDLDRSLADHARAFLADPANDPWAAAHRPPV
ncbi:MULTISPECIES: hypothetical protein [unclassified Isoptericola]|uniref:hypothetical protein n=1 Tax=unclassified Isoptericola TaxID=2623355 RepID=UPI003647003E